MSTYLERANKIWKAEAEEIADLGKTIDEESFNLVVDLIANQNGRIIIAGCGTSGVVAKKIAHTLTCIEKPSMYLNPADAVHGALGALQQDDILILISKGGNTTELLPLITPCQIKGAKLIAVTENEDSAIAKAADYLLKVKVKAEPDPFNMLATASILTVMAVFDAIAIQVMELTGYTKEQFAIIHPGGAVGERLLAK